MRHLTKIQLAKLHEKCSTHMAEMRLHDHASCFHCVARMQTATIRDWTDCGLTAICPMCGVDALLPGDYPEDVLKQMHEEYFT